jgi:hypothetical protein
MPRKPINMEAVRHTLARLDQLIAEHPELLHNPERQEALSDWLETLEEETGDATPEER